jgi:predicted regulator of Ras-like GTPase activity (Roadblock/LC7/MglB family)
MPGGTVVGELDWLLANLSATCQGIRCAVLLSPDGLPLGRSPGLSEQEAEHLSALAAGVQSLGYGASQKLGFGEVSQTIVQMTATLLFIQPAGQGTCLALLADADADAGQIAYEMTVLVKRVGQHMVAHPRFPVHGPVAR